jgi:protein phosphatase PTC1
MNKLFGSKKDKDGESDNAVTPRNSTDTSNLKPTSPSANISLKTDDLTPKTDSPARKSEETSASPTDLKKRRSSSAKAREIFTQAKNSLIHGDKDGPQTPMQKLSKTDAALSVPQGANNNSAGESQPTPNSSFLVGVTEDKNKKCRRTMEDTHSYLYNFLGTPAPVLPSDNKSLQSTKSVEEKSSLTTIPSDTASHVAETDNGYFAIFDGHAGTFAAEWCGKKLHVILEDLMRKNPNTPVPELLDQTFTSADNQLERLPLKNSGCTAICAVLRWEDRVPTTHSATGSQAIAALAAAAVKASETENGDTKDSKDETPRSNSTAAAAQAIQEAKQKATRQRVLYTANVGDARIVLCRNGKALRLSYDHKGMDENEGRRISKAGGLILNNRVNGVLAVTRALGDSYLKDLVTGHPYTTETVIQPDQDEFLILACDGVSSNEALLLRLANFHSCGMSAQIRRPSTW